MTSVGTSLASLGLVELLLATIVFASYAFALGDLVGFGGRVRAAVVGLIAATGLVGTGESWEASVVILGSVPLITGLLAFAAWILWKLAPGTTPPRAKVAPGPVPLGTALTDSVPVRWRSQMRSIRMRFQRQPR